MTESATGRRRLPTWAWVLIICGGVLLLVCGGGLAVTWFATAELREIADLPEPERTERLSKVVRKVIGDDDRVFLDFQRAVDEGRLDEAWGLTSAAFRERTDRAAFGARAAALRESLGEPRELLIVNLHRASSSDTGAALTLEYHARYENGAATVRGSLRAEPSGAWTVESWDVEPAAPEEERGGGK